MDILEFANTFIESVKNATENTGDNYDEELAKSILDYIVDNGEVNAPELCIYQNTRTRLTAYDYNDEAVSLDLFYLIKAETLCGKVNNSKIEKGFRYLMSFYKAAMDGTMDQQEECENSELGEVVKLIQDSKNNIEQLRLYIITDGIADMDAAPNSEDMNGFVVEYNVWDMQRVFQLHQLLAGKEKVEIDFPAQYNTELKCIKIDAPNPYVDSYLAIISGLTLAKIYRKYQQTILEKNVRTFLQFKGKVNKEIRRTLREQPDMFFSYNNGISTTASEITLKEVDGILFITNISDWQIVNGGQTTACIAACFNDREVSLSRVYVPVKISVIRDIEHDKEIVKAISTYNNSQTSIKNSDFSANEPYLIELENLSRQEWVLNSNRRPICKWYFERTRGQYLDQLSQLSGINEKNFKFEYPKTHKITKTDIAKYENLWKQQPYFVCGGAEKNYMKFVADIKREHPVVTVTYYKRLIAKAILFKTVDSVVNSKRLGGYKSNMNAYIVASLSYLSEGNLNLSYIWDNQRIQQKVVEKIEELIPLVWKHLTKPNGEGNQSSNINEWSKKVECWSRLKLRLEEVEKFPANLMEHESNEDGNSLNEVQKEKILQAESIEADCWFELVRWATSNNKLTPIERKEAFNLGSSRRRNRSLTLKRALGALDIIKKAKIQGFKL